MLTPDPSFVSFPVDPQAYFQRGDWHDSLQLPLKWCAGKQGLDPAGAANELVMPVRTNVRRAPPMISLDHMALLREM